MRWTYFERNTTTLENTPMHPLIEEALKFIAHGRIFGDDGNTACAITELHLH